MGARKYFGSGKYPHAPWHHHSYNAPTKIKKKKTKQNKKKTNKQTNKIYRYQPWLSFYLDLLPVDFKKWKTPIVDYRIHNPCILILCMIFSVASEINNVMHHIERGAFTAVGFLRYR